MLNILELIFLNLAFMVTFTGFLINNFESYVPAFIIKGYRYGSFGYQGSNANFLQVIEIPKSYYKHFYVFSSLFSAVALIYMYAVYFLGVEVNYYVPLILRLFLERDEAGVSGKAAFVALSLLTVQCVRRLYETQLLQVFAKSSKMNLSHYLAGLIHYFGAIVAIIGQAPLFCGQTNRAEVTWTNTWTNFWYIPCTIVFLSAWYEQYQSNVIFANLRKDKKSGKLVTEEHGVPYGRLFDRVSSPHRLCELTMYTALIILVPTSTFLCIYLWVLGNQIQTSIQAHEWYKKSFKSYPTNRYAMFPGV